MPKPNKRQNYRRCISCRTLKHKNSFWRVVRTFPQHHVTIDEGMGRSAYICPQGECLRVAQKHKKLSRALKTQIPDYIYEQLWQKLS